MLCLLDSGVILLLRYPAGVEKLLNLLLRIALEGLPELLKAADNIIIVWIILNQWIFLHIKKPFKGTICIKNKIAIIFHWKCFLIREILIVEKLSNIHYLAILFVHGIAFLMPQRQVIQNPAFINVLMVDFIRLAVFNGNTLIEILFNFFHFFF